MILLEWFVDDLHLIDQVYGVRRSTIVKNMLNYDLMLLPSLVRACARCL